MRRMEFSLFSTLKSSKLNQDSERSTAVILIASLLSSSPIGMMYSKYLRGVLSADLFSVTLKLGTCL
jgi:hypothetical protein